MTEKHPARRAPLVLTSLTALAAAALTMTAPTAALGDSTEPERGRARAHGQRPGGTQAALEEIVRQGTPGVIAEVRDGNRTWHGAAGVADLGTRRPRAARERFRIASMTKPFTATVILKLEAAGRLSLGDSVEHWLPGVVRGEGYHPERITIRHLLNHTSGIFNYNDDEAFRARYAGDEFAKNRYKTIAPRELVDIALGHPRLFQPGEPGRWAYSDTNYILAGMIIERASGHGYADEVERQIIAPLGLSGTEVPGTRPTLPRPHATHYSTLFEDGPDARIRDVTELNPSVAWAAGQIVSTTHDVNTFMTRLMQGRVLERAQQRELLDTVPVQGDDGHGGREDRYGLGIRLFKLAPGCWAWGHGGMIPGSASRTAVGGDGRHALTMNRNGDWGAQGLEDAAVRAEFC
ncbi:serine hydrolase domain-containing protein [Actinomadura terrae]|uniref:serine hydrolase domain-containing protein n=1 Tax=Actinomadura terrae TaxID=604353 RepID=UPI001FA7A9A0|nr:serine hydrolase domain-containing protein [Actinomadura terrae]